MPLAFLRLKDYRLQRMVMLKFLSRRLVGQCDGCGVKHVDVTTLRRTHGARAGIVRFGK
jgi:hypothetical protein